MDTSSTPFTLFYTNQDLSSQPPNTQERPEEVNTHSQQPDSDVTSHSRRQMHLNIQIQLNADLQAALVTLCILLFLDLIEGLAGTDRWDSTSAGNACNCNRARFLSSAWGAAFCVVCSVSGAE